MSTIICETDFLNLENENQLIGDIPELMNSKIIFNGKNNVLICEKSVRIVNSTICFNGDNSIVYLAESKYDYRLAATLHNDNVLYIGKNNYINGIVNIILSEQKHCFIGNDCLISFGVWIRNADPHLIYNTRTMLRMNPTKSIFVGDHVWLGQSVMLLKGTRIDSGSIIGALSLVAGKKYRITHLGLVILVGKYVIRFFGMVHVFMVGLIIVQKLVDILEDFRVREELEKMYTNFHMIKMNVLHGMN